MCAGAAFACRLLTLLSLGTALGFFSSVSLCNGPRHVTANDTLHDPLTWRPCYGVLPSERVCFQTIVLTYSAIKCMGVMMGVL